MQGYVIFIWGVIYIFLFNPCLWFGEWVFLNCWYHLWYSLDSKNSKDKISFQIYLHCLNLEYGYFFTPEFCTIYTINTVKKN